MGPPPPACLWSSDAAARRAIFEGDRLQSTKDCAHLCYGAFSFVFVCVCVVIERLVCCVSFAPIFKPYQTMLHLIAPHHLTSPPITSHTSRHITAHRRTSHHITRCRTTQIHISPCHTTSNSRTYHTRSYHVTSMQITLYHEQIASSYIRHFHTKPCRSMHVISFDTHMISHHTMPGYSRSYHGTSCHLMLSLVTSHLTVMSYHITS